MFTEATKSETRLRLGLVGPSGSGKTYTALRVAKGLGGRIALIDSERKSASKYAGDIVSFQTTSLDGNYSPERYIERIRGAGKLGFDVLIIDSLSHAWAGTGGALEMVDQAAKRDRANNSYTAWRDVTPLHNQLIDAILDSPCHVIATMRAKTEYVLEANDRGKMVPKKIGMKPIQRDGMEYEFDVVGDLDQDHNFIISKTRCAALDRQVLRCPGEDLAEILMRWLTDGVPMVDPRQAFAEAYLALTDELQSCRDAGALAELRDRARVMKGDMTRDQQFAVAQGLRDATERVERAAQDRHEAEEADRALAAQEEAAARAAAAQSADQQQQTPPAGEQAAP